MSDRKKKAIEPLVQTNFLVEDRQSGVNYQVCLTGQEQLELLLPASQEVNVVTTDLSKGRYKAVLYKANGKNGLAPLDEREFIVGKEPKTVTLSARVFSAAEIAGDALAIEPAPVSAPEPPTPAPEPIPEPTPAPEPAKPTEEPPKEEPPVPKPEPEPELVPAPEKEETITVSCRIIEGSLEGLRVQLTRDSSRGEIVESLSPDDEGYVFFQEQPAGRYFVVVYSGRNYLTHREVERTTGEARFKINIKDLDSKSRPKSKDAPPTLAGEPTAPPAPAPEVESKKEEPPKPPEPTETPTPEPEPPAPVPEPEAKSEPTETPAPAPEPTVVPPEPKKEEPKPDRVIVEPEKPKEPPKPTAESEKPKEEPKKTEPEAPPAVPSAAPIAPAPTNFCWKLLGWLIGALTLITVVALVSAIWPHFTQKKLGDDTYLNIQASDQATFDRGLKAMRPDGSLGQVTAPTNIVVPLSFSARGLISGSTPEKKERPTIESVRLKGLQLIIEHEGY